MPRKLLVPVIAKSAIYYGPRGGKYLDAAHTIPYAAEGPHKIKISPPPAYGMHPMDLTVRPSKDGKTVRVNGTAMPAESLKHFVADLKGEVHAPKTGKPEVDAVLAGEGKLLGKGDDGIAFQVGDKVVKVSTTVPYQPMNAGHLTPRQAARRLARQARLGNALAAKGVPTLTSKIIISGEKAFQVKDHVEIPSKFNAAQTVEVIAAIARLHEAGYALNDAIQPGVTKDGIVTLFDIGKAAKATPATLAYDKERLVDWVREHGTAAKRAKVAPDKWEAARSKLATALDRGAPPAMLSLAARAYLKEWEAFKHSANTSQELDHDEVAIAYEIATDKILGH